MDMTGGTGPPFLTSTLDGGDWSAPRTCRFTPVERYQIGVWVDRRTLLDTVEQRKNYFLYLPRNELRQSSPKPIIVPTEIFT
jgi:hypothetical protein